MTDTTLDKIADEVNKLNKVGYKGEVYVPINAIFSIIDKYKAENENEKISDITEVEIDSISKLPIYLRGYSDGKLDTLDEMREIVNSEKLGYPPSADYYKAIVKVLQIIDKYKAESEEQK